MAFEKNLFIEVVSVLRGGKAQEEASEKLNELQRACQDTGKKGSISFTLTVDPDKGDNGQYFLSDDIKLKKPELPKGRTLMFGTPEGNLQRTNPNQHEFEFRDKNKEKPEVRQISPAVTTKTVS